MASELIVQTLKGPTSGANANKVIVPSGQTLTAAGHVVDVIQNTSTSTVQMTATNTWTDVTPTVTITPKSTSNKIMVSHHAPIMAFQGTYNQHFRLLRGTTEVIQFGRFYTDVATADWQSYTAAFQYLDEPNTTSAITYTIQMIMTGGTSPQMRHNNLTGSFTPTCMTTAMEIAQ